MSRNRLFWFIVGFSFLIRILGQKISPPGFHSDEAAFGYNAYSLLMTGRDEFGKSWPLALESIGDYKSAFFAYLIIPFIKFLGLTVVAIRMPSMLAGSIAAGVCYLLALKIGLKKTTAVFVGLLVSTTPSFFLQSRFANESVVASLFSLLAAYGVISWIKKSGKGPFLLLTAIGGALAIYSYNSYRMTIPILLVGICLMLSRSVLKYWRASFLAVTVFFIILSPLLIGFFRRSDIILRRPMGSSIFKQDGIYLALWEDTTKDSSSQSVWITRFLHNKIYALGREFLRGYWRHFDVDYLIIKGDPFNRFQTPGSGAFWIICFPLLIAGIYVVLKTHNSGQRGRLIIFWWLVVSPIGSAMGIFTPNSFHSTDMVFPLCLLSGIGVEYVKSKLEFRDFRALMVLAFFVTSINLYSFLLGYFWIIPNKWMYSRNWFYGVEEAVGKLRKHDNAKKYSKVVFVGGMPFDQVAFFEGYEPEKFQNEVKKGAASEGGLFDRVESFGRYKFEPGVISGIVPEKGVLYVTLEDIDEIPHGFEKIDQVMLPNGEEIHKILELR